ncbi:hypothetical protein METHPM2_130021 [Pseudomonas sp. PM2]
MCFTLLSTLLNFRKKGSTVDAEDYSMKRRIIEDDASYDEIDLSRPLEITGLICLILLLIAASLGIACF